MKINEELFVLGEILPSDKLAVAIVGTRNPSEWGKKKTKEFSNYLAKKGVTIISGLARGIDTIAHEEALRAKGRTIAILGSGIDIIYPPENKNLAQKIIKNGAIISQFPKGTPPLGKNFLIRNGLIAKFSICTIVVEGRLRSGTISTATQAANLGKEVFAIPGPKDNPASQAPLYLIEQGASIANSPKDVWEYLKNYPIVES